MTSLQPVEERATRMSAQRLGLGGRDDPPTVEADQLARPLIFEE
jgi:hypothetical protein